MAAKTVEEFLFGEADVVHLIGEMDYKRALKNIMEEGEPFPELIRTINDHRVCLAATIGDTSHAIQVPEDML